MSLNWDNVITLKHAFGNRAVVKHGRLMKAQENAVRKALALADVMRGRSELAALLAARNTWDERYPGCKFTPFCQAIKALRADPAIPKVVYIYEPPVKRLPIGWIYFVQCNEFVKIGYTRDLTLRLNNIRTSCPYPVATLAVFEGTTDDEANLHSRFSSLRALGEWFRYEDALVEYVERLRSVDQ